jgi:hypothetical protein
VALAVAAVAAGAFLLHTDLTLTRRDAHAEIAVDARTTMRIGPFHDAVEEIIGQRAGETLVDPALEEPLAWYLRDLPVAFRRPDPEAAAVIVPAGQAVPGFAATGGTWRLAEGWYPTDLDPLKLWSWLVQREQYGNLNSVTTVEVEIMVPRP